MREGKRGNEHSQLSKKEYEQLDAGSGRESSTPGRSFEKASADVLARRKIIRARR